MPTVALDSVGGYRGVPLRDRHVNYLASESRHNRQQSSSSGAGETGNLENGAINKKNAPKITAGVIEDFAIAPLRVNGITHLAPVPLPPGLFEVSAHPELIHPDLLPPVLRRGSKRKWRQFLGRRPKYLDTLDEEQSLSTDGSYGTGSRDVSPKDEEHVSKRPRY